jgi:hypothetical protein
MFSDDDGDPLLNEAMEVIRQSGKASASLLQRRLKLGYARAARILDLLEEKGIIGPADGAKPREVFLDQLGGVGAVEFAAREHNLTGELRPMEVEGAEESPSFTAFTRDTELADDNAAGTDDETEEAREEFNGNGGFTESELGESPIQETTNELDDEIVETVGEADDPQVDSIESDEVAIESEVIAESEIENQEDNPDETEEDQLGVAEALEEIGEVLDKIEDVAESMAEAEAEEKEDSRVDARKKTIAKPAKKSKSFFDDDEWS